MKISEKIAEFVFTKYDVFLCGACTNIFGTFSSYKRDKSCSFVGAELKFGWNAVKYEI